LGTGALVGCCGGWLATNVTVTAAVEGQHLGGVFVLMAGIAEVMS
jgi:hypothetical protein